MKKIIAFVLVLAIALGLTGCASDDYKKATELYDAGNYREAMALFTELGNYKDSAEKLLACQNILNYEAAVSAYTEGDYKTAIHLFNELGSYKDSSSKLKESYIALYGESTYKMMEELEIGDTIEFGAFGFGSTKDKIVWRVVDKKGMSVMLLSEEILCYKRYHDEMVVSSSFQWEQSSIFEWLNVSFYFSAFTEEEQKLILLNNPSCTANVFLLSREETVNLSKETLKASSAHWGSADYKGYWALRTIVDIDQPGIEGRHYLMVNKYGDPVIGVGIRADEPYDIGRDGLNCGNLCTVGIRPAIWISLDA